MTDYVRRKGSPCTWRYPIPYPVCNTTCMFQEQRQRVALNKVYDADRQSLVTEIQQLRARMDNFHSSSFQEQGRIRDELALAEDQFNRREHHLKRQREFSYCICYCFSSLLCIFVSIHRTFFMHLH